MRAFACCRRLLRRVALAAAALLVFSRCDLPTAPPDFSVDPGVRLPLVFDKTFTLLGSTSGPVEALIDTTRGAFDSLFTVDAAHRVYVGQALGHFAPDGLEAALPGVSVAPVAVAASLADLNPHRLEASFAVDVGVHETEAFTIGPFPLFFAAGQVVLPIPAMPLPLPDAGLLDLAGTALRSATLTNDRSGVNELTFTLANGLATALTDGAFDPSHPPAVVVEQADGTVVARAPFDRVPAAGGSAVARVDVSKRTLYPDLRYRLDIGTAAGLAPLLAGLMQVHVQVGVSPLRYAAVRLAHLPPQDHIDVAVADLSLTSETTFAGLVTSRGTATLRLANTLPVPLHVQVLEVRNGTAVGPFPTGSPVLTRSGIDVPAHGRVEVPVAMGAAGVSPKASVAIRATSAGAATGLTLQAEDGLQVALVAEADVEQVYVRGTPQTIQKAGAVDLAAEGVDLSAPGTFVEFASGRLVLDGLENDLALGLDVLQLSLPGLRMPPYGPGDTLVVRFEGDRNDPSHYLFPAVAGKNTPFTTLLDLAGLRLYPEGGRLRYHVLARTAASAATQAIAAADRIHATVRVDEARVRAAQATVPPHVVDVTADAGADGVLDVLQDAEAEVMRLDGLDALHTLDLAGLRLEGSTLTLDVTTNITADVVLYGALAGTTSGGQPLFLGGRQELAAEPGAAAARGFTAGGTPVAAAQLLRLTVPGAPSPDQPVTRTIVLTSANSNVDDFISRLPREIRFAARAVVQSNGRPVLLRAPLDLKVTVGASIPLNLRDGATVAKTFDADFSAFADLTRAGEDATVEEATLHLAYGNGLPLGTALRVEVLDASGNVAAVLPAAGEPALRVEPAPAGTDGVATGTREGTLALRLTREQLAALGRGRQARLRLALSPNAQSTARLRATDTIRFSLKGTLRLHVQVGG